MTSLAFSEDVTEQAAVAATAWQAPLRVVHEPNAIDMVAAEDAAAAFLTALGVSLDSESLRGTPRWMARAYAEMFSPRSFDLTTFPNDEGYDELVAARSLPVRSVCEHHLLPFVGVAHVGYLPGVRILGLSKLGRGDPASGEFVAFWLRSRRVLAGMNVNTWNVTEDIEQLILSGSCPDPHGSVIPTSHFTSCDRLMDTALPRGGAGVGDEL